MFDTFKEGGGRDRSGSGWLYPGVVPYRWEHVQQMLDEAGMAGSLIKWRHPRQVWFVAARRDQREEIEKLTATLREPSA